jgi:Regulator of chromosome condensation (RCC1) repeat
MDTNGVSDSQGVSDDAPNDGEPPAKRSRAAADDNNIPDTSFGYSVYWGSFGRDFEYIQHLSEADNVQCITTTLGTSIYALTTEGLVNKISRDEATILLCKPFLQNVSMITSDTWHHVAVLRNQEMVLWDSRDEVPYNLKWTGLAVKEVCVGSLPETRGWFILALTIVGDLYSWGDNHRGVAGLGDEVQTQEKPSKILQNVVHVSNRSVHSAAVTSDGSVYSWGVDSSGHLSHGHSGGTYSVPTLVQALQYLDIVQVAFGCSHSIMLTSSGKVYSVGSHAVGQLGLGKSLRAEVLEPSLIKELELFTITKVSCGRSKSWAISSNGDLFFW